MKCPKCQKNIDRVLESRESPEMDCIRRRRLCQNCNHRFTTYERIEKQTLFVQKKDGSKELFEREKLLQALSKSVGKFFSDNLEELESIVSRVESAVLAKSEENTVTSRDIGDQVLEELAITNEVAYVRFASVYKHFTSIEEFKSELNRFKQIKNN
jgi:transcriptional repressor NrdR